MFDVRDGLKVCIERSGMKKVAIAEKIGLTDQQLCDIINKRRKLDANELLNICFEISVTPNEVFVASILNSEAAQDAISV